MFLAMITLLDWLKADRSRSKALAMHCDCTRSQLYRVAHGLRRCSVELGQKIQEGTNGAVTLAALRPDLAAAFQTGEVAA